MKRMLFIMMSLVATSSLAFAAEELQKPLYIVDGKAMTIEEFKSIASENIESMTVFKSEEQVRKFEHFGDTSNGVIVVALKNSDAEDVVFLKTDIMPSFMGGDIRTFQNWVMQNVRYPAEALEKGLEDMVLLQFVVNREGYINIDDIKILQSKHKVFVDEVKRVMASSPRWTPAIQNGRTASLNFMLPIHFQIPKDQPTPKPKFEEEKSSDAVLKLDDVSVVALAEVKSTAKGDKAPMFVIDGKPATAEQVESLPSERIKMMAVLNDESTTKYWGELGDATNGVVVIHTHSLDPRVEPDPDTLPTFLGGDIDNFSQWVQAYIRYPYDITDRSLCAHLVVKYIVNDTGYIEVVEISTINGTPHHRFDEEVRNMMLGCPQWQPATKDGKNVAYQGIVSVVFKPLE